MLVEKMWAMLDAAIDKLQDESLPDEARAEARNHARAYSRVLVMFMEPVLPTANDVAKEGMARWRARQAGEERPIPGFMHARWKTITDGSAWYPASGGYSSDPAQAIRNPSEEMATTGFKNRTAAIFDGMTQEPRGRATPAKITIPEKDWPAIKAAVAADFPKAELAKMYATTLAQINLVVAVP